MATSVGDINSPALLFYVFPANVIIIIIVVCIEVSEGKHCRHRPGAAHCLPWSLNGFLSKMCINRIESQTPKCAVNLCSDKI